MRAAHRLLVGLAPLALVAALAGCGTGTPKPAPTSFPPVQPQGAQVAARPSAAAGGAAPSCNPVASLPKLASLPTPGQMPANTAMQKIQAAGVLKVGVDQNKYLFGYRNPGSGQIEGLDIDVAREMARAIFGNPARIQLIAVTTDQRIPYLTAGTVDMVVDTFTMTCDRWQQVSFSTEYYEAGQRILVQRNSPVKGLADLGGRKVCATDGSTSIRNIAANPAKTTPAPIPVSVRDWTDCLVMLQQGQVDAVSTDDAILSGLQLQDPNDTQLVGDRFTQEPYGIAVGKGHPELVGFVNAVLDRMRTDGTLHGFYVSWLKDNAPAKVPSPTYQG